MAQPTGHGSGTSHSAKGTTRINADKELPVRDDVPTPPTSPFDFPATKTPAPHAPAQKKSSLFEFPGIDTDDRAQDTPAIDSDALSFPDTGHSPASGQETTTDIDDLTAFPEVKGGKTPQVREAAEHHATRSENLQAKRHRNTRRKIIIAIVVAVVLVALAIGTVLLRNYTKAMHRHEEAMSACTSAEQSYDSAMAQLDKQVEQAAEPLKTTKDKVSDAKVLDTLNESVKSAKELKERDIIACSADLSAEDLEDLTHQYDKQTASASNRAEIIRGNIQNVNDSVRQQSINLLKKELREALVPAQTLYDESAGMVYDETTRANLLTAINGAQNILNSGNPTKDAVTQAKDALKSAQEAVELSIADAQAVAIRQQQQQQVPQYNNNGYNNNTGTNNGTTTNPGATVTDPNGTTNNGTGSQPTTPAEPTVPNTGNGDTDTGQDTPNNQ